MVKFLDAESRSTGAKGWGRGDGESVFNEDPFSLEDERGGDGYTIM